MKNSPSVQRRTSLSKRDRQKVLVDWNATKVEYPKNACLHHLFEAQVKRTPNAVAVVFEDQQITYRELNHRANQLARYLKSLGVKTESFVAICMERSLEMVVAIYGTMKAGAAYVPIDPTYPQDRLEFMLQDANAPVLLTQEKLRAKLPAHQARVVCLDSEWPVISRESTTTPKSDVTAKNLAYMIYTSGSTGKPKGAMNMHRGICNRLLWMQDAYQLKSDDRVMQKTPFSFDVSVWEFFWPLLTGARLIVARPEGHRDSAYLAGLINAQQITTLHFVPSMLQVFLRQPGVEDCRSLRRVICSGEALPYELQQTFFKRLPFVELHNLYGPTEAAVDVTFWQCRPDSKLQIVPIGRPIANIQMYILDPQLQPVPIGEPGELHIGGVGLARGYHNRPDLTAERFIRNPFGTDRRARLYKTGDLARYLPDGNIEYLGRLDHQVKIRGFRIELGEIEALLAQHPGVRETVVIAREDAPGDKRLVAYLVPKNGSVPTISELRAHLKQKLPEYMVPAAFVSLKGMPLSPNGKVDRKALPAPDQNRPELEEAFVAPQTETEKILAEIWSEVLEVKQIGIHDNFFELGGDSIRAIQLLARAQQKGLLITLEQLFEQQTIHKVIEKLSQDHTTISVERTEPFALIGEEDRRRLPAGLEDAYPMTKLQVGMFYHNSLNPVSAVFHDIFSFRIQFPFVREKLETAINQFAARHPIMRTSFDVANFSEPLQLVHESACMPFTVADLRDLTADDQIKSLTAWIEAEKRRPFDQAQAPLVRTRAHLHSEEEFQLIVSFHHAALDGWSLAAMLTEILQDYSALIKGTGEAVPPPKVPYREYVALERKAEQSESDKRFWAEKLADPDVQVLPRWPKSYRAGGTEQMRGPEIQVQRDVFEGLKKLAQTAGVPLKSVLMAAHYRVMSFLHGKSDVISGLITNGRPEEIDAERMIGLFLNTVPLRVQLTGGTWIDLCRQVFAEERALIPHRRYPLPEIQKIAGGQSLFEATFDFVHFHVYRGLQGYKDMGFMEGHYFEANNFILFTTFMMDVTTTELQMHMDYDPEQLCLEQIKAICGYYLNTLATMATDPAAKYDSFSPLTTEERQQLLVGWNATQREFPKDKCLQELFEAQVNRTPEGVALIAGDDSLTYAELNQRANGLAHQLKAMGVGPDVLVGLCVERSVEMIVGMLGILKAGGAYVPLDPAYPAERLAFVLEDTQAPVLLTQSSLRSQLPETHTHVVCLDATEPSADKTNPVSSAQPHNLAYVIYTSGSTGKPKGVAIEHRSPVAFVHWAQAVFSPGELAGVLASTSICFDLSVFEIFATLSSGGKVILAENALALSTLPAAQQVTLINTVPSAMKELLRLQGIPTSVRVVNLAGEPTSNSLVQQIYQLPHVEKVYDLYGPSETTTYSTFTLRRADGPATVGRPIANTQVYLLDPQGQPVPVGVPGEVHIGGEGLARGYLHRPELTAEKFVSDPFSSAPGARLYRTGDLAKYLPDGNLEFLGRIDQQVKIRGFRVELGEIETVLRRHPKVKDAVVVARESAPGEKFLMGYVISRQHPVPTVQEMRDYMKQVLPDYMVPSRLMILDALPLTPNGKIDRRALPAPESAHVEVSSAFVGPRDAMEQALANIWAGVLKVDRVGVQDNFFELGGHSLLAVRLFSQIKKLTGKDLPLVTLFQAPTIEKLAAILRQEGWESPWASLVPIKPDGSKPPFYCVHGVGGNILEYLDLAKYMNQVQPFYGLQAIGLDGKRPMENLTVEQMAARYIEEIRAFQPRGPYYLGGSSFGGSVAYEMAQQLTAAGEEIALLAFFDTNGPGYPKYLPTRTAWKRKLDWWLDRAALHWGNLRASSGQEKLNYIGEKARRWNTQLRWKRQQLWDQVRERVGQVFWPAAIKQARVVGYRAGTVYQPKPYSGRATLFRATEQPRGIYPDSTLGWNGLVQGGLTIYDTPGHHGAIVREPRSRVLAQQLQDALNEVQIKHAAAPLQKKPQVLMEAETPAISMTVVVTATFTAEPIEESIAYWMNELGVNATIRFASYNQTFQQLLDPESLVSKNQHGINLHLIRIEDWWRSAGEGHGKTEAVKKSVHDFANALKENSNRSTSAHFVCLCPDSPEARLEDGYANCSDQMERMLVAELAGVSGVYTVPSKELTATYPVTDYYDAEADNLGHVAYTPEYFTALGTIMARRIYALKAEPRKVIVLDCDQTLWGGVCGEDGPAGVTIDLPRSALQEFMVAQHDAGRLLCLCTKNNEQDVWSVFQTRTEMALKRDHLVTWRINWQPKSENLKSLATELRLGLDSFIFIDDNPVECAEVEAGCPEALTILLPPAADQIPQFLRNVWAFDHLRLTGEDQRRTALYQEDVRRERFHQEAPSFEAFLAGLELEISIAPMREEQLPRVAQLTLRTNQFNCTTIRRTESELQELIQQTGTEVLTVEVKDRFGDYGLVGLVIFRTEANRLAVDTFLLSCRALGKGVEHRMLAYLGELAASRGCEWVDINLVRTPKNGPAFDFIASVAGDRLQAAGNEYNCRLPAALVAAVTPKPKSAADAQPSLPAASEPTITTPHSGPGVFLSNARLHWIAAEMNEARRIHSTIAAGKKVKRSQKKGAGGHATRGKTLPAHEVRKVEAALLQHPGLRAAVVISQSERQGKKRLVAYVVSRNGPPDSRELREFLLQKLPEYMVPSRFMVFDHLPIGANGKVDRAALGKAK
jgi:amino acid adenylation domain-containing protein/FkbH-like protein